jgi:hypothetical protein
MLLARTPEVPKIFQPSQHFDDTEDQPEYLPVQMIEDSVRRLNGRLADNYAQEINSFFQRHPEYADLQANRNIVSESLERSHVGTSVTESALEDLLDVGNQSGCAGQLLKSASAIEAEGINERTVALQNKIIANAPPLTPTGDKQLDAAKQKERQIQEEKIRAMSMDQLLIVRNNQQLRQSTKDEVRAIVKQEDRARQANQRQYPPFPEIGFVPDGKDESCAVPMTRKLWSLLPASVCRKLLVRHGEKEINRVLDAADAQQRAAQKGNS